jgi:hypothetical protein
MTYRRALSIFAILAALTVITLSLRYWWFWTVSPDTERTDNASPAFEFVVESRGLEQAIVSGSRDRLFIFESLGTGAALIDYDGDERVDVLVQNGGTVKRHETAGRSSVELVPGPGPTLYRQGIDGRFMDVTSKSGIPSCAWGTGVAVADVDNDGDPDVFLSALGPNRLLINESDGQFRDATKTSGVDHPGCATSAAFLDYDRDGWIDLYVANYVEFDFDNPPNQGRPCLEANVPVSCAPSMHYPAADILFRNRGDGTFEDVTTIAGCSGTVGAYGLGVVTADFNRDGWPDIYVANDTTANFLWVNRGDGTFENLALSHGAALSETGQGQSGMGVTVGDANGDGWSDIFVTNYALEPNAYYRSFGDGTFAEQSTVAGLGVASHRYLGWGTRFLDIDHDGRLDLIAVNGHVHPNVSEVGNDLSFSQQPLLFRGLGQGQFESVQGLQGDFVTPRNYRGLAVGDVDRDGALDLLITVLDGPPLLCLNRSQQRGNWIGFRVRGRTSNRDGIGARIEITTGQTTQFQEISGAGGYLCAVEPVAHFGLGAVTSVESVRVRWPNGETADLGPASGNRYHLLDEVRGLSSPDKNR